jgi:hypothetical protein
MPHLAVKRKATIPNGNQVASAARDLGYEGPSSAGSGRTVVETLRESWADTYFIPACRVQKFIRSHNHH